jgi:S-adenosylmethionine hydrolase
MIALFTDFGPLGPYTGQMIAALKRVAPSLEALVLMSDAPTFNPRASAYLLAALLDDLPPGAVVLGVVDPGVGGERRPVAVEVDGRWLVGPDNGLFAIAARRAAEARWYEIAWRPERLSASFHGRDLFAPVAARLALGAAPPGPPIGAAGVVGSDWLDDLTELIYVDHFGNVMTGLRAARIGTDKMLVAGGCMVRHARTFGSVNPGAAFWYENANGLCEIAVNRARADLALGLSVGLAVEVVGGRGG